MKLPDLSSPHFGDLIAGIVLMAISAIVFAATFELPEVRYTDPLGMAFFPRLLMVALFGFSVLISAKGLRGVKSEGNEKEKPSGTDNTTEK